MALRSGLGLAAAFAAAVGCGFFAVRFLRTPAHETEPPRGSTVEPPPATPPAPEIVSGPLPPPPVHDAAPTYDHASLVRARDEARGVAARSDVHAGLAAYAAAEDYVRAAVESAKKRGDKAVEAEWTEIYKELIADSDAYAAKVLTPAFIEATSWRDLLAQEDLWSRAINVPGFTFQIRDGVLSCTGSAPGSNKEGAISILDQKADDLRHFILEMEFQVDGLATVYFHVHPPPRPPSNQDSEAFDITNRGGGLDKAAKNLMRVEYVGSRITFSFPDGPVGTWAPNPSWAKRRRGGIAVRIPAGTRLTITRMRIKDLR